MCGECHKEYTASNTFLYVHIEMYTSVAEVCVEGGTKSVRYPIPLFMCILRCVDM